MRVSVLEMDEEDWDDFQYGCDDARQCAEKRVAASAGSCKAPAHGTMKTDAAPGSHTVADAASISHRSGKVWRNELMTHQQLSTWKEAMIGEVANLLNVTRIIAKRLLTHYSWDNALIKTTVCEEWFEGKRAEVLSRIGESPEQQLVLARNSGGAENRMECMVCFDEFIPADISWSRCGHMFCNACWSMHIKQQITEGNVGTAVCLSYT